MSIYRRKANNARAKSLARAVISPANRTVTEANFQAMGVLVSDLWAGRWVAVLNETYRCFRIAGLCPVMT
ncbi:MAG: hypothetical protein ACTS5I_00455 [Rhodanobacter sp.]